MPLDLDNTPFDGWPIPRIAAAEPLFYYCYPTLMSFKKLKTTVIGAVTALESICLKGNLPVWLR